MLKESIKVIIKDSDGKLVDRLETNSLLDVAEIKATAQAYGLDAQIVEID